MSLIAMTRRAHLGIEIATGERCGAAVDTHIEVVAVASTDEVRTARKAWGRVVKPGRACETAFRALRPLE
jgi:hypothetical protein